jgi:hypothetical protein
MFVQAGNERFVHHMLLYGCLGNKTEYMGKPEACYDETSEIMDNCNDVYGGWAVGGQVGLNFFDPGVESYTF